MSNAPRQLDRTRGARLGLADPAQLVAAPAHLRPGLPRRRRVPLRRSARQATVLVDPRHRLHGARLGRFSARRRIPRRRGSAGSWAVGLWVAVWIAGIVHACLINSSWLQWRAHYIPWYAEPTAPPPTWQGATPFAPPAPAFPASPRSLPRRRFRPRPRPLPRRLSRPPRHRCRRPCRCSPAPYYVSGATGDLRVAAGGRGRQHRHGRGPGQAAGVRSGPRAPDRRRTPDQVRVQQRGRVRVRRRPGPAPVRAAAGPADVQPAGRPAGVLRAGPRP